MINVQISEDYSRYLDNLKELIIKFDMLEVNSTNKDEKAENIEILKEAYNKMFLYQLYKDKNLIAITGLQGAGKTSLTRDYFDIPKNILPENNSRGEKLPVFITVGKVEEIKVYRYTKIIENKKISIKKEKIDKGKLKEVSMNPDENKDLWIQLIMPIQKSKFNDPDTYIVLLPGFEKTSDDFSQKLLDFIIDISKTSIVVIDKNEAARKSSNINLERIEEKFEDFKPIIALTHGDENPEENEEVRKGIIERLNIIDEKRVIVTGPKGMFDDNWQERLTELLVSYSGKEGNNVENRQLSMKELLYDIFYSLKDISSLLEDEAKTLDIEEYGYELSNSANLFRREYEEYLTKLEKLLTQKMEVIKDKKSEDIINYIEKNTSFLKNIKTKIFGKNLKEEMKFKNRIIEIWEGESDNTSALATMNEMAEKQLLEYSKLFTLPDSKIDNENYKNALIKQDNRIQRINNYFKSNEEVEVLEKLDISGLVYLGSKFLTSSFKAFESPKEASKYLSAINYDEEDSINKDSENKINISLYDSEKIDTDIKEMGKKVATAMPIVLGVDIVADGKADVLNNAIEGAQDLSKVLGDIGIRISSKALIGIIGFSGATIISSYAISKNIQDMNRRKFELYNNAILFVDSLAKTQVQSYINSLRNVFEFIEQKIAFKHAILNNKGEKHSSLEKCQYLLSNVYKLTESSIERSQYEELLF